MYINIHKHIHTNIHKHIHIQIHKHTHIQIQLLAAHLCYIRTHVYTSSRDMYNNDVGERFMK
jgi:hypothetical protein